MDSLNDLDRNHQVDDEDREVLSGVIRKAETILKRLTADKLMPKYDSDTIRHLETTRLILIEVKADLNRDWGF